MVVGEVAFGPISKNMLLNHFKAFKKANDIRKTTTSNMRYFNFCKLVNWQNGVRVLLGNKHPLKTAQLNTTIKPYYHHVYHSVNLSACNFMGIQLQNCHRWFATKEKVIIQTIQTLCMVYNQDKNTLKILAPANE